MSRSDERGTLRPEVDQTVSLGYIKRIAALYSLLFVAALAVGGALWATGSRGLALIVWMFGNGFTAFVGIVTVSWDLFEYRADRRNETSDHPQETSDHRQTPERELAPSWALSQDVRIAGKVFLVLIGVTVVVALVILWFLG